MVLTYFLNVFKIIIIIIIFIVVVVVSGSAAQRGLWPPRTRGFVISHNDTP
jgi:hypothetical protein